METTKNDNIEKRYVYRYAWLPTITMLIFGGLGISTTTYFGILRGGFLPWFFGIISGIIFVFFLWISIVGWQGKLRFMISPAGIYIPLIWNSNKHRFVRFADVSGATILEFQGNVILELSVGKKKYPITHTWFPSMRDFQEIVATVMERIPAHIKEKILADERRPNTA